MKVVQTTLSGMALVAMLAAAPALADRMAKNSRTVIRIDQAQQGAPAAQQGSIANGTASTQGLLLPAVQKVRASDVEPRKGGVNVAVGDVNGDGVADAAGGSSRPQETSTQGPYQLRTNQATAPKAIPKATLYGRKQGSE